MTPAPAAAAGCSCTTITASPGHAWAAGAQTTRANAGAAAPPRTGASHVDGRPQGGVTSTVAGGNFETKELPAGRFTINASKGGFVTLQYGQRRPSESGTPIELGDGQTLDKLTIALPRGSVLGGRITAEFGEPVANASVIAMRYSYAAGGRRLTAAPGSNSRDTTDDQGHYRLFGLPPGEYFVSARLRSGPEGADPTGEVPGYAATYFPGTPNLNGRCRACRSCGLRASEDYLIVAARGLEDGQAGDPEFLASVKDAAAKFTLADGEAKAVDVTLSAPK